MKRLAMLLPLFLSACATSTHSALFGAAVGGGIGGGIGQLESKNFRGTASGMLIGASLGGLVGFLAHKDQAKTTPEAPKSAEPTSDEFPALTKPKLRSMWVPDTIEGNKYIKGHFIYVIEDPGTWSK
jgi:hypothetical protein